MTAFIFQFPTWLGTFVLGLLGFVLFEVGAFLTLVLAAIAREWWIFRSIDRAIRRRAK